MSFMSELDRQHEEARDLSGIDVVECERDYLRDLLERLHRFVVPFLNGPVCLCRSNKEHEEHAALKRDINAALACIKGPERDAESKPDTSQG